MVYALSPYVMQPCRLRAIRTRCHGGARTHGRPPRPMHDDPGVRKLGDGQKTRHAFWQGRVLADEPLFLHVVRRRLEGARAWLCALSLFGAALCARFVFASWLEPEAFLTFFPAVLGSALLCSWRHGLA